MTNSKKLMTSSSVRFVLFLRVLSPSSHFLITAIALLMGTFVNRLYTTSWEFMISSSFNLKSLNCLLN